MARGAAAELASLRANLLQAIGLARETMPAAEAAGVRREVAVAESGAEGGACRVLCALPDGSGMWCRAVTIASASGVDGVSVRITTPVAEDYRGRQHTLQPDALRPDFEIAPHVHFARHARVLAPYTDGLWYSARVACDGERSRTRLQVVFDEYADSGEFSVPMDQVIPRQATHEPGGGDDSAEQSARPGPRSQTREEEGDEAARTLAAGAEAQWEQHTRGIGSRLLAKMGHVPGQALGADNGRKAGFALAKPIEIRVLPARRALDYISEQPKKKKRKKAQPERNYSTTEDMFSFVRRLIPYPLALGLLVS